MERVRRARSTDRMPAIAAITAVGVGPFVMYEKAEESNPRQETTATFANGVFYILRVCVAFLLGLMNS